MDAKLTQAFLDFTDFDTFGGDRHGQVIAQTRNRVDDGRTFRVLDERGDKALINLDAVKWQGAQVGERAVTGAEIIKGNFDALILKAADD